MVNKMETLTVKELIEQLQNLKKPNAKVLICDHADLYEISGVKKYTRMEIHIGTKYRK